MLVRYRVTRLNQGNFPVRANIVVGVLMLGDDDSLAGFILTIQGTLAHTGRGFTDRDNQVGLVGRIGSNRIFNRLLTGNCCDSSPPDRFQRLISFTVRTNRHGATEFRVYPVNAYSDLYSASVVKHCVRTYLEESLMLYAPTLIILAFVNHKIQKPVSRYSRAEQHAEISPIYRPRYELHTALDHHFLNQRF